MPDHLEPVPRLSPDEEEWFRHVRRASWWRWVAVVVIIAMVVASPFAYALYRLLH